ncbi:MAG: DUF2194 domain-containing protein [Halioglobus sp.]
MPPDSLPAFAGSDFEEQGLVFPGRALPAFAGLSLEAVDLPNHSGINIWPTHDVETIATTTSGKRVAWRRILDKGRVLYWNTTLLCEKRARGLIIETLNCLQAVSVVPLANVGTVQIDDFPAPLDNTLRGAVARQYPKLSGLEFYCRVWYPDMLALSRKHRLPLTCFCLFDYTNRTEPPFVPWRGPEQQAGAGNPATDCFAAVVAQPPAELGLHGFNHLSLATENWPDSETMAMSLHAALEAWEKAGLGALPTSYAPPGNEYDETGMVTLLAAIPGLQSICGNYMGMPEDRGGNREFGPEPWNRNLFCIPRATAGYECTDRALFDAASQIAAVGAWTHFLHADDVCDTPEGRGVRHEQRNPANRGWRDQPAVPGLYSSFERLVMSLRNRFPWLTFMTASDATGRLKHFLEDRWSVRMEEGCIRVEGQPGATFQLRLNGRPRPKLSNCVGGKVLHSDKAEDFSTYVITQTAQEVEITISEPRSLGELVASIRQLAPVWLRA